MRHGVRQLAIAIQCETTMPTKKLAAGISMRYVTANQTGGAAMFGRSNEGGQLPTSKKRKPQGTINCTGATDQQVFCGTNSTPVAP